MERGSETGATLAPSPARSAPSQLTENDGQVVVTVDHSEQRVARYVAHRVAHVLLQDPIQHVILLESITCNRQKWEAGKTIGTAQVSGRDREKIKKKKRKKNSKNEIKMLKEEEKKKKGYYHDSYFSMLLISFRFFFVGFLIDIYIYIYTYIYINIYIYI